MNEPSEHMQQDGGAPADNEVNFGQVPQADAMALDGAGAQANEQSAVANASDEQLADGFVMINAANSNAAIVNAPPADRNQDADAIAASDAVNDDADAGAKPEFGPVASKILAPFSNLVKNAANNGLSTMPQNFDNHVVLMKGITWGRDSHGLFDYESRHLTKKTLKANREVMILRSENELTLVNYKNTRSFQEQFSAAQKTPNDMAMLKIVNHNNSTFYLESAAHQPMKEDQDHILANGKTQESMYLVVRSLKINNEKIDYEIQPKDILKIGRVKFAVKEIGYSDASIRMDVDQQHQEERGHSANSIFTDTNDEDFEEFIQVPATMHDMSETDPERKCRFCWMTEASEENPLLGTCKCAGSVGQIHFQCLQSWLKMRQQSKLSANFSTYFWKAFECEICKTPYPLMMKAEGKTYNLVKYDKPEGDFMVLESLSQEKNNSRIIHIIRPSATKTIFKLGRGHESDLRINDISVSRCHTKIKFEKGKFMLEDNQSKFGTLVLVKQRTPLLPGFNKAVQVGRTVINFSVKLMQRNESVTGSNTTSEPNLAESNDGGASNFTGGPSHNIPHQSALPTPMSLMGSVQNRMQRQPSEREMQPSAEAQFEAQLGQNQPSQPAHSAQMQPPAQPQPQANNNAPENYNENFAHMANLPEDYQLQLALQASMQEAAGESGNAQSSRSNNANEGGDANADQH